MTTDDLPLTTYCLLLITYCRYPSPHLQDATAHAIEHGHVQESLVHDASVTGCDAPLSSATHRVIPLTYYLLLHYLPLTTYYLLLTTDYLLLAIYYLLLTTYYLLLTAYCSLLTTCYLLLTTYYC